MVSGENETLSVTPLSQEYEVAPAPFKTVEAPKQMVLGVAEAVTVGLAFTVTVTVAVFVQVFASVPVTV